MCSLVFSHSYCSEEVSTLNSDTEARLTEINVFQEQAQVTELQVKKTKRTDLFSVDFMQVLTPASGQNKSGQVRSHTYDKQYRLYVRYHTVC